jgi:hypothetical protein
LRHICCLGRSAQVLYCTSTLALHSGCIGINACPSRHGTLRQHRPSIHAHYDLNSDLCSLYCSCACLIGIEATTRPHPGQHNNITSFEITSQCGSGAVSINEICSHHWHVEHIDSHQFFGPARQIARAGLTRTCVSESLALDGASNQNCARVRRCADTASPKPQCISGLICHLTPQVPGAILYGKVVMPQSNTGMSNRLTPKLRHDQSPAVRCSEPRSTGACCNPAAASLILCSLCFDVLPASDQAPSSSKQPRHLGTLLSARLFTVPL